MVLTRHSAQSGHPIGYAAEREGEDGVELLGAVDTIQAVCRPSP